MTFATIRYLALAALLLSPLTLTVAGCSNTCDNALDKLEECGAITSPADPDCEDAADCKASCVNDATCDEITGVTPTPNSYSDCTDACS